MSISMSRTTLHAACAASLAVCLTGCNLTGAMDPPQAMPTGQVAGGLKPFVPNSPAGLEVKPDADTAKLPKLVAMRDKAGAYGIARSDPFALTSAERGFETTQEGERVFGGGGGFGSVGLQLKPTEDVEVTPEEPQPYRRLSGIVVGDSILAILEEQGQQPVIVTPGMKLPNSEWRVVSIDQDKAVLRRPGKVRPTQVIVPLEQPRPGFGPPATNGGNNGGGFPGGAPGGPGGYPGGGFPGAGRGGKGPGAAGD